MKETVREPEEGRPEKVYEGSTLNKMKIDRHQSSNWQNIAEIPEEQFEDYIQSKAEITTSGAVKIAKKLKTLEQRKELAEKGKGVKLDKSIDLRLGDFRNVLSDIEPINLILTDPPYTAEYLPLWGDLAKFAKNKLKDNGYLIAYSGQYHLPQVINYLSSELDYIWTFCLYHEGNTQIVNNVNVICRWKPILIFQKNKTKFKDTIQDYIILDKREKGYHNWQQGLPAIQKFIEYFTNPGDIVCDPFSGSGTVLLACKNSNRLFIGAEINIENYNITKERTQNGL